MSRISRYQESIEKFIKNKNIELYFAEEFSDLTTGLISAGSNYPLCVIYPIGRGEYYNKISIDITASANPMLNGIYTLDIFFTYIK